MVKLLKKAPLMRLFRLVVTEDAQEEFAHVGQHNLTTSIKTEAGTLAMYSTQDPVDENEHYVLEIYQDEESYQKHVAAAHFKAFADFAKDNVLDRAIFPLNPQLLLEKEVPLFLTSGEAIFFQLSQIEIKPEANPSFKAMISKKMKLSMQHIPNLLAMYTGTLIDNPNHWYIIEIYRKGAIHEMDQPVSQVQDYIKEVTDMVISKEFKLLNPDVLVNQGGLSFEA